MKKLPVIRLNETTAEKRELRQRITLANRPRLDVGLRRLDEVAARLAGNGGERRHFAQDPTGYLRAQALPVTSCRLVSSRAPQTAEACSVNTACNVNALANVNAATKVNVALALIALTLTFAVNTTYAYNKVSWWGVIEEASSLAPAAGWDGSPGMGLL